MRKISRTVLIAAVILPIAGPASAQVKTYPLESIEALTLHNVSAEPATLQGKKGVRLVFSEETRRRLEAMTPEARNQSRLEQLATIKDLEFSNGIIEAELAGAPGGEQHPVDLAGGQDLMVVQELEQETVTRGDVGIDGQQAGRTRERQE